MFRMNDLVGKKVPKISNHSPKKKKNRRQTGTIHNKTGRKWPLTEPAIELLPPRTPDNLSLSNTHAHTHIYIHTHTQHTCPSWPRCHLDSSSSRKPHRIGKCGGVWKRQAASWLPAQRRCVTSCFVLSNGTPLRALGPLLFRWRRLDHVRQLVANFVCLVPRKSESCFHVAFTTLLFRTTMEKQHVRNKKKIPYSPFNFCTFSFLKRTSINFFYTNLDWV